MAVVTPSPLLASIAGKLGNSCLRRQHGRTVWERTPDPPYVPTTARTAWTNNLKDMRTAAAILLPLIPKAAPYSPLCNASSWWAWMVQQNATLNLSRKWDMPFPNDSDLPQPNPCTVTHLGGYSFRWDWDGVCATSSYWFAIGVKKQGATAHEFSCVGNTLKFWSAQLKTATRLAPQMIGCQTFCWFIHKTTGKFSMIYKMYPPY